MMPYKSRILSSTSPSGTKRTTPRKVKKKKKKPRKKNESFYRTPYTALGGVEVRPTDELITFINDRDQTPRDYVLNKFMKI